MRKKIIMLTVVLALGVHLNAQSMQVSVADQVKMIERILKYDRALAGRAGDTIDILFVDFPNDATLSANEKATILSDFNSLDQKKVNKKKLSKHELSWSGAEDFSNYVKNNSIEIVYILPAEKTKIKAITRLSPELQVLTIGGLIPFLTEYISIAIAKAGSSTKIFLNPDQSKREGANLSADLMKMAQIIRPG